MTPLRKVTPDQAEKTLAGNSSVTGFLLSTQVKKPKYSGGGLKVRLEIAIFTYPGRALKGSYEVGLTQPGVTSTDIASENELLQMAAERAVEKFLEAAARIQ